MGILFQLAMLVYQRVYIYMNECDQKNSMVSSIHLPTWWATFCKHITQQFAPEKNAVPPEGKDHLPTINFQRLLLLISGMVKPRLAHHKFVDPDQGGIPPKPVPSMWAQRA